MVAVSPAGLESDRCRALVLTGLGATGGRVFTDDDLIITSSYITYRYAPSACKMFQTTNYVSRPGRSGHLTSDGKGVHVHRL